jgi:hypothetical protein
MRWAAHDVRPHSGGIDAAGAVVLDRGEQIRRFL